MQGCVNMEAFAKVVWIIILQEWSKHIPVHYLVRWHGQTTRKCQNLIPGRVKILLAVEEPASAVLRSEINKKLICPTDFDLPFHSRSKKIKFIHISL